MLASLALAPASAAARTTVPGRLFPSHQLLVSVRDGFLPSIVAPDAADGLRGTEPIGLDRRVARFTYRDTAAAATALRELRANPAVRHVEPNTHRRLAWTPQEPHFEDQTTWLEQVNAPGAWNMATGDADTIVAVIDSGVSPSHPDLINRLVPGYNAVDGTDNSADIDGHGTHVAGIIAAQANEVGTVGIAMDVRIMPIRVVDDAGNIDVGDEIEAIDWAVANGADVINLSFGSDVYVQAERDAIVRAIAAGVIVVASAGNSPIAVSYPAHYDEVISVGSLNADGLPSAFTSLVTRVDLAAPGESIYSPGWDEFYGDYWDDVFYTNFSSVSGTSFSTAMVSAAVGLLRSVTPETPSEVIRALLTGTARDTDGPESSAGSGAGRLNIEEAVRLALYGEITGTWQRTDGPVVGGSVRRTWLWGEQPRAWAYEPYADAPHGNRLVYYYDKSRMEVTDPLASRQDAWYVTNGLLVTELTTGRIQVGDESFDTHSPAEVNVAGDLDDPLGPTYASFSDLLSMPAGVAGNSIILTIERSGRVNADSSLARYGVTGEFYVAETQHRVASVFWDYLNSIGYIQSDDGDLTIGRLFDPWFYATGYPITEPFWSRVKLDGSYVDVLIQCFERRCMTYTPSNALGWQVEMGNVGLHYYTWRYGAAPNNANGLPDTPPQSAPRRELTTTREPLRGGPGRGQLLQ
jgi:subtilisin family serine protease